MAERPIHRCFTERPSRWRWQAQCGCGWRGALRWLPLRAERDAESHLTEGRQLTTAAHVHYFTQRPLSAPSPDEELRAVGRRFLPSEPAWFKAFHCQDCGADLVRAQRQRDGHEVRAIRSPGGEWISIDALPGAAPEPKQEKEPTYNHLQDLHVSSEQEKAAQAHALTEAKRDLEAAALQQGEESQ